MEFIDGHPVTETRVRFRQRATVAENQTSVVRDGDLLVWLVKARCRPPQYYPTGRDEEERYKLAIQDVEEVAPLDGALRESAIVYLDHGHDQGYIATEDQLPLDLAFGAPRVSPNGFVDPAEVMELRELLGGLTKAGERLAETVRRLLYNEVERVIRDEPRPPAPVSPALPPEDFPGPGEPTMDLLEHDDAEYDNAVQRARAALNDEPAPKPARALHEPLIPIDGDVEVVGRVYRGRSSLQDILDREFGGPQ